MQAAPDPADCIAYLMGNHITAERMFRYEPRAMLYAPLHTVIWEDGDSNAWFTVDQPSTQFSSFGIPAVAEVGSSSIASSRSCWTSWASRHLGHSP